MLLSYLVPVVISIFTFIVKLKSVLTFYPSYCIIPYSSKKYFSRRGINNMDPSTFVAFFHDALNAYNKMCEPILEEFDIPQVSFDILMFLKNNPDLCTAQQISEFRNIKKNLVSVHVDKLVTAGYLQRGTVAGDRRKILLSCTGKAQPILNAGLKMQQNFKQELTRNISGEHISIYKEIIEAMAGNVRRMLNE